MAADSSSLHNPSKTQKRQQNAWSSSFICKGAFVCVLIAILPIFPSGSPETNKTVLARGLELLHLLLAGVAISYGLFSRRNSDHPHPPEAASSAFGDEGAAEEPLFLPVRRLKPAAEGGRLGKEGIVLPSPIPWRSRSSRRTEVKEDSARKKSFPKSSPPPPPPLGVEKKTSFKDEVEHSTYGSGPYGGPRDERTERNELRAKMVTGSDSEEEEEDDGSGSSDAEELPDSASVVGRAGTEEEEENEVDKKADEFIAKFREQIRLQRIASLKRLTRATNT